MFGGVYVCFSLLLCVFAPIVLVQDPFRRRVHPRETALHVLRGAGEAERRQARDFRGGLADPGHDAPLAGVPVQPRHEEKQGSSRPAGVWHQHIPGSVFLRLGPAFDDIFGR